MPATAASCGPRPRIHRRPLAVAMTAKPAARQSAASVSSASEKGKYQAPAMLPTATPIADVGNQYNQYAGAAASQPIEHSQQNSSASTSADESKSSTPPPVSYQSAYGGAGEYQSGSSNNVNPPNYERTNDPQARIDSPAAPSASSNTAFGGSQNYQSHPADVTATTGYGNSTPASTRNSAAVAMPGYGANDPFVASNPKRTTNQAVGQTTGSQNRKRAILGGPNHCESSVRKSKLFESIQ